MKKNIACRQGVVDIIETEIRHFMPESREVKQLIDDRVLKLQDAEPVGQNPEANQIP